MVRLASSPLKRLWRQYRAVLAYGLLLMCAAAGQHRGYGGACVAVAICAAVLRGARTGAVIGAAAGLLWDAFAERRTAYHALLLAAVCVMVGALSDREWLRGLIGTLLIAGATSALCIAIQGATGSSPFMWGQVGGAMGWTLLFYPIMRRVGRWLCKST